MAGRPDYWLLVEGLRSPRALEEYLRQLLDSGMRPTWDLVHHILDVISQHPWGSLGVGARTFYAAVLKTAVECPCNSLASPQATLTCLRAREKALEELSGIGGWDERLLEAYRRLLEPCEAARGLARHLGIVDPAYRWVIVG